MVSSGLQIHDTVERRWNTPLWQHLRTPTWKWLAHHTEHADWSGCTFWDLIQPSFMFTVGCALAFSIAARVDQWFLNLFPPYRSADPRSQFRFSSGGYQTLNFVPSPATMIFGLLAGELIRARLSNQRKLLFMLGAGLAGIVIGWLLGWLGICPVVKRIWTPPWAIYSAGWSFLLLAEFYWVIEVARCKMWAFPLVVMGMNPIAAYCMWQVLVPGVRENLTRHLGPNVYEVFGQPYAPMVESGFFLLFCWLVCWWMYRRKVFLRI